MKDCLVLYNHPDGAQYTHNVYIYVMISHTDRFYILTLQEVYGLWFVCHIQLRYCINSLAHLVLPFNHSLLLVEQQSAMLRTIPPEISSCRMSNLPHEIGPTLIDLKYQFILSIQSTSNYTKFPPFIKTLLKSFFFVYNKTILLIFKYPFIIKLIFFPLNNNQLTQLFL